MALATAGAVCIFGAWSFSNWGMANSASIRTGDTDVALFLTELAPDDPQTHYTAGVLLIKSFDPGNMQRGLDELETAARLAPENYMFWLELGQARERGGDPEGAERALRRALDLAPNYSRVRWALGNMLLRAGHTEEAFAEIKTAVAGDPNSFADQAASSAWHFLEGDINIVRQLAAGSPEFEASVVTLLVREKRFDEAMQMWNRLPPEKKRGQLRERGTAISAKMLGEKKIRYGLSVLRDISAQGTDADVGRISNGGFESAVKPSGAGPFEWEIAAGLQPQIVLSSGQKHSGSNSLLIFFNSTDGKDFRSVSQLVPVEPDTLYELEIFYRAELKLPTTLRWQIVDADGKQLAVSESILNRVEWAPLSVGFRSSATSDGIIVRLIRDTCGQVCPASGSVWFDDVSLRNSGGR